MLAEYLVSVLTQTEVPIIEYTFVPVEQNLPNCEHEWSMQHSTQPPMNSGK